jgi:hypothetical protein
VKFEICGRLGAFGDALDAVKPVRRTEPAARRLIVARWMSGVAMGMAYIIGSIISR